MGALIKFAMDSSRSLLMNSPTMSSGSTSMDSMKMYFHTSESVQMIFEEWSTGSTGSYYASLLAVIGFAILAELMGLGEKSFAKMPGMYALEMIFYTLRQLAHFVNMLFFMTYNVGVCVSVIIGLVLGKLISDGVKKKMAAAPNSAETTNGNAVAMEEVTTKPDATSQDANQDAKQM